MTSDSAVWMDRCKVKQIADGTNVCNGRISTIGVELRKASLIVITMAISITPTNKKRQTIFKVFLTTQSRVQLTCFRFCRPKQIAPGYSCQTSRPDCLHSKQRALCLIILGNFPFHLKVPNIFAKKNVLGRFLLPSASRNVIEITINDLWLQLNVVKSNNWKDSKSGLIQLFGTGSLYCFANSICPFTPVKHQVNIPNSQKNLNLMIL